MNNSSSVAFNNKSDRLKLILNFIAPSLLSLIVSVLIAGVTFLTYHYHYFLSKGYDQYEYPALSHISVNFNKQVSNFFGTSTSDLIILILFWGSVGLIVYILARMLTRDLVELSSDIYATKKFLWPQGSKPKILPEFVERIFLRVAAFIVLIFFSIHALSFFGSGKIVPLGIGGSRLRNVIGSHDIVMDIIFIVSEIIAVQLIVIFSRFVALRSRIF